MGGVAFMRAVTRGSGGFLGILWPWFRTDVCAPWGGVMFVLGHVGVLFWHGDINSADNGRVSQVGMMVGYVFWKCQEICILETRYRYQDQTM